MNFTYRKKPVEIEAFQMTAKRWENREDWPAWALSAVFATPPSAGSLWEGVDGRPRIGTLEGEHIVSWDDYIIRGVKGEIYACKPDIFAATYDEVEPFVSGQEIEDYIADDFMDRNE